MQSLRRALQLDDRPVHAARQVVHLQFDHLPGIATDLGLPTTLWFDRGDGSPLTMISMPLSSSTTSQTFATQALSSGCGTISGTQPVGKGGSSVPTIGGPVPDPTPNQNLSTGYSGSCTEDPRPPSWNGYRFANTYHVRDHLGTLRLETGAGGEVTGRHDFYPFGTQVPEAGGVVDTDGSRKRYTGHERDAGTGLDYMLARYYGGAMGRFSAVDPLRASALSVAPQSWNRVAYAANTPIGVVDPDGRRNEWKTHNATRIAIVMAWDQFEGRGSRNEAGAAAYINPLKQRVANVDSVVIPAIGDADKHIQNTMLMAGLN